MGEVGRGHRCSEHLYITSIAATSTHTPRTVPLQLDRGTHIPPRVVLAGFKEAPLLPWDGLVEKVRKEVLSVLVVRFWRLQCVDPLPASPFLASQCRRDEAVVYEFMHACTVSVCGTVSVF